MLHKTRGMVLNTINYNDKYVLSTVFSEDFGCVTYMVAKTKGKSTKVPRSLFSPMALLAMDVDHQPLRDIQRVREVQPILQFYSIQNDMKKTSLVFFLSEFLTRVLKDISDSKLLFDFLEHSAQILEMTNNSIANYHLVFILKLSKFLGFYPNLEDYELGQYFDLLNGEYVSVRPLHQHYINQQESFALSRLHRITFENMHRYGFTQQERMNIINRMLEYYRLHLYDFPNLKSLDVLHEISC